MQSLGKWQIYENGTWKDVVVNSINVVNTQIIAFIYASNSGSAGTITKVRVFDILGSVAAEWNVNISRSSVQNVLLKVVLPIEEV